MGTHRFLVFLGQAERVKAYQQLARIEASQFPDLEKRDKTKIINHLMKIVETEQDKKKKIEGGWDKLRGIFKK